MDSRQRLKREAVAALSIVITVLTGSVYSSKSSDVLDTNPYLVIYPNSLIPGVPLDVRVTIVNASAAVSVRVELWDVHQHVLATNTRDVASGETKHVELSIPMGLKDLGSQGYAVRVSGTGGGLTFDISGYIKLEQKQKSLHIITQLDKSRYAGGQDVKFRSVLLLPNMMGYKGNATVTIYDGKGNKIQVMGPMTTKEGVVEGMLTLSQEPVFGVWKLVTEAQGVTETKPFTVKPYVLPKFSVSITKLGDNDTNIEVKVTARYTFNSDVHGSCKLEIYQDSSPQSSYITLNKEIQGSTTFHIKMHQVTSNYGVYHSSLGIRASVTDMASAITMVAEKAGFIPEHLRYVSSNKMVHVKQLDNRRTFVPGMNFYTTISLVKEDTTVHTPSKIAVTVNIKTAVLKPCMLAHPPYMWLEVFTNHLPQFYIDADDTGLAPLNIPVPHNAEEVTVQVTSELSGYGDSFTLYPLVKEGTPMLRLVPHTPHVKIGETVDVSVTATEEMTGKLIVEVYARGIALQLTSMEVTATRMTTVSVPVTADMVPYTHVVVSHITTNNSFMYDYAIINVQGSPLRNKVTVGFNTTSLEPGKDVEMTLTADPNSTVYVLTEDQKNRLLGADNDIFLYQLDEVASETGYNVSGPNRNRQTKRSAAAPKAPTVLRTDLYTSGYTFMDDGLVVLPENNNILSRTTYYEGLSHQYHYTRQCVNNQFTTTPYPYYPYPGQVYPGMVPTPAPGRTYAPGVFPTYVPGMVPTPAPGMTYAPMFSTPMTNAGSGSNVAAPVVRNYFPETWIWEQFPVGPSGNLSLPLTVPDSITSWVTSVFATNENTGFGLETTKPKITVKQDFFVTMDPPKLIVLGEEFLLQLTIFNYLDSMQQVLVQVNTTDDPGNLLESTFNVNPGEGHSTFFQITPKKVGQMKVTALARAGFFSNIALDEIVREVTVKPNGVHKRSNEQHLVEVSSDSFNQTILLVDPPNMVPGSKSIKMSITGDFMTNTIEGLEQLISMPFGCGEQTMLNFAPDIYVTKYLQTVGKLTDKVRNKALRFMRSGLQRELTYKHYDGSFSAFGDSDSSGSSWLTAFVLKCFQQADGLLDIDENIKATGVNWLLRYQHSDGSFYEPGRIIHTQMQAGTASGLKLTAFILISILENANHITSATRAASTVAKASSYLEKNLDTVSDMYTYAIVCYALAKSGKTSCFNRLESLAVHDGNKMSWTANTQVSSSGSSVSTRDAKVRAPSADIEATSYCLLTYLELGEKTRAKPVVNWLISQRNPSGGFQSTQDTIVSLQALSQFASHSQPGSQVDVNAHGGVFSHAYSVTKANADLLHMVELPASLTDVLVTATGQGSAVVDVTQSYYVSGIENNHQISVTGTIIAESINSISVRTCVRWDGAETSGMIVAEVEMPTGFGYDADTLNNDRIVKKHEQLGQNVALYFDGIGPHLQVCPIVKLDRQDPVVKSQACHITVYDYYEPTNQARTRYESGLLKSSTICDVCPECSFCNNGGSGVGQIGVGK